MHQTINTAPAQRWAMLRTSGAHTVALADSLTAAGFEVWTPVRTSRRMLATGRRAKAETRAPILPTFVFARASQLPDLARAAADPSNPHTGFSIFHHAGRVPLVGGSEVTGLQQAEQEAAEAYQRQQEIEDREERRRERAAALRTEKARRKAMRAESRQFADRSRVQVADMPAFAGMMGVIEQSNGRSAVVSFGGSLVMTIEAWRLSVYDVEDVEQSPIIMAGTAA